MSKDNNWLFTSCFTALQKLADYYDRIGYTASYYKIKQCIDILEELYYH